MGVLFLKLYEILVCVIHILIVTSNDVGGISDDPRISAWHRADDSFITARKQGGIMYAECHSAPKLHILQKNISDIIFL